MARRHRLTMHPGARDFIGAQPEKIQGWFAEILSALLDNPWDTRSKELKGTENAFEGMRLRRIPVSKKYRIIYCVNREDDELIVTEAGWRSDIYSGH